MLAIVRRRARRTLDAGLGHGGDGSHSGQAGNFLVDQARSQVVLDELCENERWVWNRRRPCGKEWNAVFYEGESLSHPSRRGSYVVGRGRLREQQYVPHDFCTFAYPRSYDIAYSPTAFKAAAAIDLVYNFIEEEKGKIVIVPQITRGFFDIHVARWLMEFRADLLDPSDIMNHKSPYTTSPDGSQNSVVWRRTSNAFFNLKQIGGAGEYDLVQVLDGQGNKLEPAYSDFVKGCSNWREMNERREDGTFEMFWLEDNEHPETQGGTQRIVYGRDIESAANDEYYFRIAE